MKIKKRKKKHCLTAPHKSSKREKEQVIMVQFGKKVVKFRIPILIISILLLIPSVLGYVNLLPCRLPDLFDGTHRTVR